MSDEVKQEPVVTEENVQAEEAVVESTEGLAPREVEAEELTIDDSERIVEMNKQLENYEVVLTKFTDVLTLTESNLINPEVKKTIITLGGEVYSLGAKYCETNDTDDLYKFLAKNFEYIGMYLFTFSTAETLVGVLTSKIDNLLNDFIGNQEDLLGQFNLFQQNFRGNENDIKSIITPLIFNLSNLGTNIGCAKTIMHYLKLQNETNIETILENIILHIEK